MVAQELALAHPEGVERLVLVATLPGGRLTALMPLKAAHPQTEPAWRAQATAGVLFDQLGRQRRITQPTLILQGTADQVVNPVNAELLAELIPDARLRYVEGRAT